MDLINQSTTIPQLLRNVVRSVHAEKDTFLLHKVDDRWEEISYQQTLAQADAVSSYFLGYFYAEGYGCSPNAKASLDWFLASFHNCCCTMV